MKISQSLLLLTGNYIPMVDDSFHFYSLDMGDIGRNFYQTNQPCTYSRKQRTMSLVFYWWLH